MIEDSVVKEVINDCSMNNFLSSEDKLVEYIYNKSALRILNNNNGDRIHWSSIFLLLLIMMYKYNLQNGVSIDGVLKTYHRLLIMFEKEIQDEAISSGIGDVVNFKNYLSDDNLCKIQNFFDKEESDNDYFSETRSEGILSSYKRWEEAYNCIYKTLN